MGVERPASEATRRIAIVAPMPSELRPLVRPLGLVPLSEGRPGLLRGAAGRIEIVAALAGIGMRAGGRAALRILDAVSPHHLVVVGIAGGIGAGVSVGDLIVPELVRDLDSGASFRPAPLGEAPRRGTLVSSDALLEAPEQALRLGQRGVVAIDMETAAVAAVCEEHGCPWSVFRAVSDRADDGSTDAAILGLAKPDGRPDLAAVARFVLTRPGRIGQLLRLARGARTATRVAAAAALAALASG